MLCLEVPTDRAWVTAALDDLDRVLVDHAHCEMKAAANALSLVARHPGDFALTRALVALAREELDHFERVVAFLEARGLTLGPPPVDAYAAELRRAAATLPREPRVSVLVDRLLVGALIEARSCERFGLLADVLEATSRAADLVPFYRELFACEAKHYRIYVDLAKSAAPGLAPRAVEARLARLAHLEGRIVDGLASGPERSTVHG
jgi:tRNA-(ms[2]io[6]A)-hydroxylase